MALQGCVCLLRSYRKVEMKKKKRKKKKGERKNKKEMEMLCSSNKLGKVFVSHRVSCPTRPPTTRQLVKSFAFFVHGTLDVFLMRVS
jgi:hypothetical protein